MARVVVAPRAAAPAAGARAAPAAEGRAEAGARAATTRARRATRRVAGAATGRAEQPCRGARALNARNVGPACRPPKRSAQRFFVRYARGSARPPPPPLGRARRRELRSRGRPPPHCVCLGSVRGAVLRSPQLKLLETFVGFAGPPLRKGRRRAHRLPCSIRRSPTIHGSIRVMLRASSMPR